MTTPPQCLPGALIAGKYRVEGTLGRGGMGVVVAATNEMLGHRVAVKVLHAHIAESSEQVTRLLREARLVAQLRSEHVARVLDVDRLDDGNPFVVLEYLAGQDLAEVLLERRRLPVEEAVDYILQALDVVAEAHSKELVHRDLKPSNLFLTTKNDGSSLIKVLDFGIAKTSGPLPDLEQALTAGQSMIGSPAYMSPEQIREARSVDARADIWSLGVIIYEFISGENPFRATTVGTTFSKIFSRDFTPLEVKLPGTPSELSAIVDRCLELDAEKRIQDVGTLARLLSPFASERGRRAALGVTSVLSNATLAMGSAITPRNYQPEVLASRQRVEALDARASAETLESIEGEPSEPRLPSFEAIALSTTTIVAPGEHVHSIAEPESTQRQRGRTPLAIAAALVSMVVLVGAVLAATRTPSPSALDVQLPPGAELSSTSAAPNDSAPTLLSPMVVPSGSTVVSPVVDVTGSTSAAPVVASMAGQTTTKSSKTPVGSGKAKQRVPAQQPKQQPFSQRGLELDRRD